MEKNENNEEKKKIGIGKIILIILFLPIFAVWYIWKKTNWSNGKKSLATAGVVILTLAVVASNSDENIATENSSLDVSQTEQAETEQVKENVESQAIENSAEPAEELSEEEQIKQLVTSQFKGKNNLDKDYVKGVEVVEQIDGGWGVFVEYNADDNLTTNMRKKSIEMDMSKIYTALYTSDKDIQTSSVSAYFPLVDKYGNESDGVVYKSMLEKSEAEKVNWEIDKSYLGMEILPSVWETTFIHPEFR